MSESLLERFPERRRPHAEDRGPVDDFEHVRRHERAQLLHRERRVAIEQRVRFEKDPEETVRYPLNVRPAAGRLFDGPNEIDVVDVLLPRDVVDAGDLALDSRDDDIAEVADIKRLTDVAARSRDGKDGHALHEAREPPQVLSIDPAEHQRGPQYDMLDSRCGNERFLCFPRFGVMV